MERTCNNSIRFVRRCFLLAGLTFAILVPCNTSNFLFAQEQQETISADELELIREVENQRIKVIEKVVGSVIAIYGPSRQGGGSGVLIDPSGIALTNHHVIEGAGMKGFGGLDDGELYEWDLVGTDPGGDVAIIKLRGKDEFPYSPLGNSDLVQVGDWALAMGNPFLLAHDQVPTVTLGVVSGVERFQEGMGAQLVYGNCIQVDSSINPGNSGGPLFNMNGEVIGINGRGSFQDRGRVNVGLGYAISSNQIKNFIPDLLATKITEHGTLDAAFSNRKGKVVCSTIDLDSPAAEAGLELGDELLEFEGRKITFANQFKNLICTYPEDWPASLRIRKEDGKELTINVRMFGLPYNFQPEEETEEEKPEEGKKDDPMEEPEGNPQDEPEEQPKEGKQAGGKEQEKNEKEQEPGNREESKDEEHAKDMQESGEQDSDDNDGSAEKVPTPNIPTDTPVPLPENPGIPGIPEIPDDEKPADNVELKKYLLNEPGVVVDYEVNAASTKFVMEKWRQFSIIEKPNAKGFQITDEIRQAEKPIGTQTIRVAVDGRFRVTHQIDGKQALNYLYDGQKFWQQNEKGDWEAIDLVEAKIQPIVTQGFAFVAPLQKKPLAVFGKTILDGSDKSQGKIASRLLWLDSDDDWFYGWLGMYDDQGDVSVSLLKIASDRDCKGSSRGMTFQDYRETNGLMLPWKKDLVRGLNEQIVWTAVTKSIEPLAEIDESMFSAEKDSNE